MSDAIRFNNQPIACPIHPSLVRPILLGGADRTLVLLNVTCIVTLLFGIGLHGITVGLALLLAIVGQGLLIRLAKYDPDFSQIYLRHIRYRDVYLAQSPVITPALYVAR